MDHPEPARRAAPAAGRAHLLGWVAVTATALAAAGWVVALVVVREGVLAVGLAACLGWAALMVWFLREQSDVPRWLVYGGFVVGIVATAVAIGLGWLASPLVFVGLVAPYPIGTFLYVLARERRPKARRAD